ncbi:MAG: tRNA dimethylallyltransferase [Verrucomicrobiota bacterium]|jgi:tRNA dimethylallyltransferase
MPDAGSPLFIAGQTASGKSDVALLLAERCGGEIISVDSMQVYRGLDIGTAKLSVEERRGLPHHLIDVANLDEAFDAARFVSLARGAVEEIEARGRRPIFCGGTGLYFKAFLQGLGESPPGDAGLRAELQQTPLPELLRELSEGDPAAFEQMDQKNPRRVVRAIEVMRLTGRPFSAQRAAWRPADAGGPSSKVFALDRDPEELRSRIDARVTGMFESGLVEETKELLTRGLESNPAAMQAIGYRQVVEHLQGHRSLDETIALVEQRTRQFAKRQKTWLRHQLPVEWIPVAPGESAEAVADRIGNKLKT